MRKSANKTDKSKGKQTADPGEQLRLAREARKFSIESVAERLHLAVEVIQALEKAEYSKLPAPTYIRGYLRSYATYVGINGDKLVEEYNQMAGDMPPDLVLEAIPSVSQPGKKPDSTIVILFIVVVVALLVLLGWWSIESSGPADGITLQEQEQATDQMEHVLPEQEALMPVIASPATSAGQMSGSETVSATDQVVAPISANDEQLVKPAGNTPPRAAPETVATVESSPPVPVATLPAAIPGQLRLSLAFDGSSWVEVRDANNKRLLVRLARAGSRYNVAGKPPLHVVLGNARVVRLMVNDKSYSHQAYIRGNLARFYIQADSE